MSIRSARAQTRSLFVRTALLWSTGAVVLIAIVAAIAFANRVPRIDTQAPALSLLSAGQPAPPFSIASTQGSMSLDATKKPIFLEVFATWCPHCQRETEVINRLYDRYKDRVAFLAVSGSPYANDRTSPESLQDVLDFADYFKVRYPVAYDGSLSVMKAYLQGGYPTIAIISRDKRIVYINSGEIRDKVLDSQLDRLVRRR